MLNDEEPFSKNELQQSPYDYNKVLLLSFFLGIFGAHRFYVRRRNSAIVMLILGFLSFGILSLIWNIVDFINIFLGKFRDANRLTIESEKGNPVKGVLVLFICLVFLIFVIGVIDLMNSSREIMSEVESSVTNEIPVTSQEPKVEDSKIAMVSYEFNQPIEIFDYYGENIGTITVKSARMIMGEEAMVEVTYEITKKLKNFYERIELYTYDGSFLPSFLDKNKYTFEESYLSPEIINLLGIKNNRVNWNLELEETTLLVTKYYKYRTLKENFVIGFPFDEKGDKKVAVINLKPLVENKTLDLSVLDQLPITEQDDTVVPLGEEKKIVMIDIRVNRSKIGKGKDFLMDNNYLDKDRTYIILDVDIKNSSAVALTEEDVFSDFMLLDNTFHGEDKYFIWNDKLEVADETLIIKPGESKKIALAFITYKESSEKEKIRYFTYNPQHIEDNLTKFSIVE